MSTRYQASAVVLLALLATPIYATSPAAATYYYTGNVFDNLLVSPGVTTSDKIHASFTLNSPLGSSFAFGAVSPVSWAISAGTFSLNSASFADVSTWQVGTDSNGFINRWSIAVQSYGQAFGFQLSNQSNIITFSNAGSGYDFFVQYQNATAPELLGPLGNATPPIVAMAYTTSGPGSFPTPEPSSAILFLGGGILAIGWKRVRRARAGL